MTWSEADAKKGWIDELNSTLQHFANESEEQINFDSGSSKSISNWNESKWSDKNKKNKKRQDKKTNEVNEEIGKAARMRPKKKETNGEKKEESKSKRMNKQVDKKSKFVMSGFDSIAARNNRNKEGKSDQSYDSDMKNSKIRNIKYFENLEYTEK